MALPSDPEERASDWTAGTSMGLRTFGLQRCRRETKATGIRRGDEAGYARVEFLRPRGDFARRAGELYRVEDSIAVQWGETAEILRTQCERARANRRVGMGVAFEVPKRRSVASC
jgi:hypothetical protein